MLLGTKPFRKNGENSEGFVEIYRNKEKGIAIPLGFFNLFSPIYSHIAWQQGTALLQEIWKGKLGIIHFCV